MKFRHEIDDDPQFLLDWDVEPTTVRRREASMGSIIAHLVAIILLILQPKLFPMRPFITPEMDQLARMQRVFVYLPPDTQKVEKPPDTPVISDKDRIAIKPKLHVDPRALQVPPAPPPGDMNPPGTPKLPEAPAQRLAQREPGQVARLESPPEPQAQQTGRIPLPITSAGRAIEESIKGGAPGSPGSVGSGGGGLPGGLSDRRSNFSTSEPLILSDTRGVDFGPYLARVLAAVRRNWYAVIPESARLGAKGKVVLVFSIQKDGSVPALQPAVTRTSGQEPLDRAALSAILASTPFPPLPRQFTGDHITLQFTFLYNLPFDY